MTPVDSGKLQLRWPAIAGHPGGDPTSAIELAVPQCNNG
jgi:hypothetical protein